MTYVHGVQAARERLALAQQALRDANTQRGIIERLNAEADAVEKQVRALRKMNANIYRPISGENMHGGREGLLAAAAEIAEYNARKRAQKAGA